MWNIKIDPAIVLLSLTVLIVFVFFGYCLGEVFNRLIVGVLVSQEKKEALIFINEQCKNGLDYAKMNKKTSIKDANFECEIMALSRECKNISGKEIILNELNEREASIIYTKADYCRTKNDQ